MTEIQSCEVVANRWLRDSKRRTERTQLINASASRKYFSIDASWAHGAMGFLSWGLEDMLEKNNRLACVPSGTDNESSSIKNE